MSVFSDAFAEHVALHARKEIVKSTPGLPQSNEVSSAYFQTVASFYAKVQSLGKGNLALEQKQNFCFENPLPKVGDFVATQYVDKDIHASGMHILWRIDAIDVQKIDDSVGEFFSLLNEFCGQNKEIRLSIDTKQFKNTFSYSVCFSLFAKIEEIIKLDLYYQADSAKLARNFLRPAYNTIARFAVNQYQISANKYTECLCIVAEALGENRDIFSTERKKISELLKESGFLPSDVKPKPLGINKFYATYGEKQTQVDV